LFSDWFRIFSGGQQAGETAMPLPQTLKELITQNSHDGFKLAIGHYAELKHGCMGFFPVIESATRNMVITTDLELLKRVCSTLMPRRFQFGTQLIYINPKKGIAYSILKTDKLALEKATPFQVLTEARFQQLSKKKKPFMWAPGLVSDDMSHEEFQETLKAALASI
jgi:hypothetical protein